MSVFLLNRSPEPGETGVPIDEEIFLEVVDDAGNDIDLSATRVFVASEGGGEVLAFDAGTFQPGFDGPNSASSAPALGIRRINVDLSATFVSEEEFTVHVLSANDAATPETIDETYTFFVEDVTPPRVESIEALDLQTVRLTWDEPVKQASATGSDDALNPSAYSITRLTAPSVDVSATSVASVSANAVDITTDIELSPAKRYRITASGVADTLGNVVQAPFDSAEFVAFEPSEPADRDFALYRMLPLMNRQEDATEDLLKFISCLQEVTDLSLWQIDRWIDALLDPDTADEQFIDAMLADLGNPFAFAVSLSLMNKRRLLRSLLDIYALKGTEVGIVQVVLFFLGLTVTIDRYADEQTLILGESELGQSNDGDWILGTSAQSLLYSFVVNSAVALTTDQKSKITEIVSYMKPAHTHFLGFVEPSTPTVIDHLELGLSELGVEWTLH